MSELQYRLKHFGGLWHWEVLTACGVLLGHGATLAREGAAAEALVYAIHPARAVEIDTIELARSADQVNFAHRALVEAQRRQQVANQRVSELIWLRSRSQTLASASQAAVAETRKLLAIV